MKTLLHVFVFLIGLSSCIVKKPIHSGLTAYDKNNVMEINNPRYKKKISFTGAVVQLGAAAGGAFGAMQLKPTTFYDSENKAKSNKVMNGVIGAAVGYGVTSLYYVMRGQRQEKPIEKNKFRDWLMKHNRRNGGVNYVFTNFKTGSGYLVLPNNKKTQQSYIPTDVESAVMFKNAFPRSERNKEFETLSAGKIYTQRDASLFLEYYPNSIYTNSVLAKQRKFYADEAAAAEAARLARQRAEENARLERQAQNALMAAGLIGGVAWIFKKLSENTGSSSGSYTPDYNVTNNSSSAYTILSTSKDTQLRVEYKPSTRDFVGLYVYSKNKECEHYVSTISSTHGLLKKNIGKDGAFDDNSDQVTSSVDSNGLNISISYHSTINNGVCTSEYTRTISASINIKPGGQYTIYVLPK